MDGIGSRIDHLFQAADHLVQIVGSSRTDKDAPLDPITPLLQVGSDSGPSGITRDVEQTSTVNKTPC